MIAFQTEHRTIFLQTKGFPFNIAVEINAINAIWALHFSTTLSTTVTLAKKNQEWHARMATFGILHDCFCFLVIPQYLIRFVCSRVWWIALIRV